MGDDFITIEIGGKVKAKTTTRTVNKKQKSIILLGETGVGKSSLANFITSGDGDKGPFRVSHGAEGCLVSCPSASVEYRDSIITVYDTQGFGSHNHSEKSTTRFLANQLGKVKNCCAIIFVDKNGNPRIKDLHVEILRVLHSILGEELQNLLVFCGTGAGVCRNPAVGPSSRGYRNVACDLVGLDGSGVPGISIESKPEHVVVCHAEEPMPPDVFLRQDVDHRERCAGDHERLMKFIIGREATVDILSAAKRVSLQAPERNDEALEKVILCNEGEIKVYASCREMIEKLIQGMEHLAGPPVEIAERMNNFLKKMSEKCGTVDFGTMEEGLRLYYSRCMPLHAAHGRFFADAYMCLSQCSQGSNRGLESEVLEHLNACIDFMCVESQSMAWEVKKLTDQNKELRRMKTTWVGRAIKRATNAAYFIWCAAENRVDSALVFAASLFGFGKKAAPAPEPSDTPFPCLVNKG